MSTQSPGTPGRVEQTHPTAAHEDATGALADNLGPADPDTSTRSTWLLAGLVLVVALALATRYLSRQVPVWADGTALHSLAGSIEFPIYAIGLGLVANLVLSRLGLLEHLVSAFRTEFFIKTGVVLLGASVNLSVIVSAAVPAIVQALLLISSVFLFTWWIAGRLGLDDKLRALLASAVSICGVSAAISAAGAVRAKREQLAYAASLVIVFALPSIFVLP